MCVCVCVCVETIPRNFHSKELAAIKQTLSKFGTTYETLDGLQNELTQPQSFLPNVIKSTIVADGAMQSCNSLKKATPQSHHNPHHRHHQLLQRRGRRGSRNMTSLFDVCQNGGHQV